MTTKSTPVNFGNIAVFLLAQASLQQQYRGPIKKPGGMGPAWDRYSAKASQFIKDNNLATAADVMRNSFNAADQSTMQQYFAEDFLDWHWLNGGWPGPHLHYANNMYPVTISQWKAFAKPLMAEMTQKVSAAQTVTFAQFQEIANF